MARIDDDDSMSFFGFESGQSLAGALIEAGEFLRTNHPAIERIDQHAVRAEFRSDEKTYYVVLPYREDGGY